MHTSVLLYVCALVAGAAAESAEERSLSEVAVVDGMKLEANEEKPQRRKRQVIGAKNRVTSIELTSLMENELTPCFLSSVPELRKFVATHGNVTTVPAEFFTYAPNIQYINLSDNQLESLPSGLFSALRNLSILHLFNNRLTAHVLYVIAPVTSLTDLRLNRNPIGDHCQPGTDNSVLSGLQKLTNLDLSQTNANKVCGDWLPHMRNLRNFYLAQNNIDTIWCSEFVEGRAFFIESKIELDRNPLTHFICSSRDVPAQIPTGLPELGQLWVDRPTTCDCGQYWLVKAMAARQVRVVFRPEYQPEPCQREWLRCSGALIHK